MELGVCCAATVHRGRRDRSYRSNPGFAAHHSFSAEFDSKKPVTLVGEVVMMEWVNPHSWLHIDVKKPDGSVERWKVEGGSAGA